MAVQTRELRRHAAGRWGLQTNGRGPPASGRVALRTSGAGNILQGSKRNKFKIQASPLEIHAMVAVPFDTEFIALLGLTIGVTQLVVEGFNYIGAPTLLKACQHKYDMYKTEFFAAAPRLSCGHQAAEVTQACEVPCAAELQGE